MSAEKSVRFMRCWFEKDGGALMASITVPYFSGRPDAKSDAIAFATKQLAGEGWTRVQSSDRGNVEAHPSSYGGW